MAIISDNVKRAAIEARISGRGVKEIATELDISVASVAKWRSCAEELGINVPEGHVRKKKSFQLPQVPPAVWEMRRRAVQIRAAGGNSVEAAAASGLRLQDIRINWRAWAEHLEIEVPSVMSPEELLEELREDDSEEHPADEATTEARNEEEPMEVNKNASEEILRLMGDVDRLLSKYLDSGNTVSRFVLDVDGCNFCELSTGVDEELGHRYLAFEMRISIPMEEDGDV